MSQSWSMVVTRGLLETNLLIYPAVPKIWLHIKCVLNSVYQVSHLNTAVRSRHDWQHVGVEELCNTVCFFSLCFSDSLSSKPVINECEGHLEFIKAIWHLKPSLTPCLLSDMWRQLLFLSLSFNLSQNLWSADLGKCHHNCLFCYPTSHINIYLHPYTDLFLCSSSILHLNTTAPSSNPFKPHCNAVFHSSFTSILSVPPPCWSVFPGCVQPSTARPLSPRRASFPSCSLCVRMVSGMSLASCSIKTPRESTYAPYLVLFFVISLPMTKMGSNGFCSHYMVWIAVIITTCSSGHMSC